ncbi:restriction endonuclease subunit S [Pseudohongiella sp. SYSU M77423]|uniref:restriction endonuclease subunit S n=1 Tax=Pseudohongiella sp. SYSU M77423 TaxID=3042312 RepID=UPI002480F784|nr:restriction endonuclease subunit S [Pseudohongiella sp. SYSU M77423]MDH7943851.1 restriction endonuclease subunit S [Pseudohongiella sp. SYSU M77423]
MARSLSQEKIPAGWRYDLLDRFATRCSGHTPSKSFPEYWGGGIKWISLADSYRLDKGYIYQSDNEISDTGLKNSSAELHPAETVILSRDAGIGKSGVIAVPMAVSQHFIAWKCDNNKTINSWFLYNWLQLNKKEFERQAVGSTIKTIGLPYFKKLRIALPPYAEQKKIAQILSTWDKAITTTEQLLTNSQQQKKALMQQLLTGNKRLLDKNGVCFSGEWKHSYLKQLLDISKGVQLNKDTLSKAGAFPVINGGVEPSGYTSAFNTQANTITISEGGNSCGHVGFQTKNFWCGGHCYAIKNLKINPAFAYHLLKFNQIRIMRLRVGSGLPNIQKRDLESLNVNFPSDSEEQQEIASILSAADEKIEILQQKLDALRKEKKALMQQILTGKRRVSVCNGGDH